MYTVANPDPINPRGGGQLLNPDECHSPLTSATRGEMLTPNPNQCNSTLTSVTGGSFLYPYIIIGGIPPPCKILLRQAPAILH